MKKLATWVLTLVFLFSFALPQGTASAQSYDLNWTVDDVEVEGNLQPFMLNDKVLIPVEKLCNKHSPNSGFRFSCRRNQSER